MAGNTTATGQPQYTISDADRQRQKQIANAWDAYFGDLEKPLEKIQGEPDDNVMSNRCVGVVNAGMYFLFGKELQISAEADAPAIAQKILDAAWGRKEKRVPLLQKLCISGEMAGTAFLRIVPQPKKNTFRLIVVDPATVCVQTAPQDCETVLLYCIEYSSSELINGNPQDVYYREEITRVDPDDDGDDGDPFADIDATWSIQHWTRVGQKGNWTTVGDPIDWPYEFPPLFSCQNFPNPHDFWGLPDITKDVIGLNNALNLAQSDANRKLKTNGAIVYASGTGEQVIDRKPGRIIGFESTDSKVTAVGIPSEMADTRGFADDLRSDIDEVTSVPGVATARISAMPRGDMSGVAIELCFLPLLKKTEAKQCTYGELIIDVSKALLVLNGLSEDIDITLAWQSPLPSNDLPAAQRGVLLQQLGISNTTIQRDLGFDPDEEQNLTQHEQTQKMLAAAKGQAVPQSPTQPQPSAPGTSAPDQSQQQTQASTAQPLQGQQGGSQQ